METKEIIQALKCCHNLDECDGCEYNELGGFCEELLKRDAAKRLEKLEAELEKRTINDRPYEWISVEDEPLPKLSCEINRMWYRHPNDLPVYIAFYGNGVSNGVTHWMQLDPPKPKEPTFKDVFLKAFPQAVVLEHSGVPRVCAKEVFLQLGDYESPCDMRCKECWSRPYFEEEGGEK